MLLDFILNQFKEYFEQNPDHDTILWFDPRNEWEGLLPYFKPYLELKIYEGSQLSLRYYLVNRVDGEKVVVYLPLKKEDAAYLRPFFFTSKLHESSIESTLRDCGIALPDNQEVIRSLRSLLSALAVVSIGKGEAFWKDVVNLETALSRLIPDFEDNLLRLLTSPQQTIAELKARKIAEPFFELLSNQFGIAPPPEGEVEEWANRFTANLCLVDLYLSAKKPKDFPFESTLPEPIHWDRYLNFLQKWQRDEVFKDAFAHRARAIDNQYSLGSWVQGLSQLPLTSGFLNVEKTIWEDVCELLEEIGDKHQAISFCRANQDQFQQRAQGFWAREGSLASWSILDRMAQVVIEADNALDDLSQFVTTQSLIQQYTQSWWQVDRAYRQFRAELDQGTSHLDAALKWVQRIYQDFLEATNIRLGGLLTQEGHWPIAEKSLGISDLWKTLQPNDQVRRALLIVDGLRYELGQDLSERLPIGSQVIPGFTYSPLPSITPLGMAALLPGSSEFQVEYSKGKWIIRTPEFDGNLAEKAHRLAFLEKTLGNVAFYGLDQWLNTPLKNNQSDVSWLIITSSEIDAIGEGGGTVAWYTFNVLIDRLEQAVRRLLAAGCEEIHIVSDHGFLLRENIRDTDKVDVKKVDGVLKKAERYLVGTNLPPTDFPSFTIQGSEQLRAWFPRGIDCFVTPGPYNYMHGGISLQELITAHITVKQMVMEKPVGVSLELVSGPDIRNAIFKVRLIPQSVDLWSRGRKIKIDIARIDGQERVSDFWEDEIHRNMIEKSLRLAPDYGLKVGDAISIRVWDTVTDELLVEVPATLYVDLDL